MKLEGNDENQRRGILRLGNKDTLAGVNDANRLTDPSNLPYALTVLKGCGCILRRNILGAAKEVMIAQ